MTSFNEVVTTFLLIRHGSTALVGKALAGRLPSVPLDALGRDQAQMLAQRLANRGINAIYSSPLQRATETAEPLAKQLGLPVVLRDGLTEIDFGVWQGKTLIELAGDPRWSQFNSLRSSTEAPGGELMLQTQSRMARELEELRASHPGETVAVFSHADVIKAALMLYLGSPLDYHSRLEISPAEVSVIELAEWGPRVLSINSGC
jgi:probable phosphomutase (TIGR03848 family)